MPLKWPVFYHGNVFKFSASLSALQALIKSSVTVNTNPFVLDIRRLINASLQVIKNYIFTEFLLILLLTIKRTVQLKKRYILLSRQTYLLHSLIFSIVLKSKLRREQKDRISWNQNLRIENFSEAITILLLNQLRAVHVQLAASIFKINIALDTKCQCDSLVQDLNHIIWQCPNFNDKRNVLIIKQCGICYFPPHIMDFFLSKPYTTPLLKIHKFGICNGFVSSAQLCSSVTQQFSQFQL